MDTSIITAIIQRVQAKHDVSLVRFEIYDDESWAVSAPIEDSPGRIDLYDGYTLSDLPALLSSLK